MENVLDVRVTDTDFVFDFGDFQIETSKEFIEEIESLSWYNGCLMIHVTDDVESIGLENLMFGEEPFNIPGDYVLKGKDTLARAELLGYLKLIKSVKWVK